VNFEMYRRGQGWLPVSDDALALHSKMDQGDIVFFKPLRVRCPKDLRRYWALMTKCAENCERIELDYNAIMLVKCKDDVSDAVKLCTGYCTTIFDMNGKPVYQIPKSISFDNMEQTEWEEYWPKVVDVVMQRIMPGVSLPEIELELLKCMRLAA